MNSGFVTSTVVNFGFVSTTMFSCSGLVLNNLNYRGVWGWTDSLSST